MSKPTSSLLLALIAAACAVGPPANAKHRSITGTWELISYEAPGRAGDLPLGDEPIGLIVYDRNGNVSAQLMRRDRHAPHSAASAEPGGTVVTAGYVAYFGKYSVDWTASVVTHSIVGALSTSDIGRVLKRRFRFEGELLVLEVGDGAETRILKWRRVAH